LRSETRRDTFIAAGAIMRRTSPKTVLPYLIIFICVIIFAGGPDASAQEWSHFQYLTDFGSMISYVHINATDSILHIFANSIHHLYHFISFDNGASWSLLADEAEPNIDDFNGGPIASFYGQDKYYTVYDARERGRPQHEGFIYFRASADNGQSWAWSSNLRVSDLEEEAKYPNITGYGDLIFVAASQVSDNIEFQQLWRSYDAGQSWEQLNVPVTGRGIWNPGFEYDTSTCILHLAFQHYYPNDSCDIYYLGSTDNGNNWSDPVYIGVSDMEGEGPALASDGIGNIAIIWSVWDPGRRLYCRVSHDQGFSWGDTTRISGFANPYAFDVTVWNKYVGVAWGSYDYLYYIESFDGGLTWGLPQQIAPGLFIWTLSLMRTDATIHIAFRQDVPYSRAGYVRRDPVTGIWGEVKYLPSEISLSAYPNPFNSATMISYEGLAGGGHLYIYDIAGRLVRTLALEKSQGAVVWDATREDGEAISSGIYFAEVVDKSNSTKTQIKLLHLK
jgi:hypothetical protein